MTDHAQFAQLLTSWYKEKVRTFLSEVASDRIEQLDQEFARFVKLTDMLKADMPVCFLGTAGVGKSTLINALVAGRDVILPAGGVGPLTAEATRVRYADRRRFAVEYHPPAKLNNVLFGLERAYEKELLRQGRDVGPLTGVADAAPDDLKDETVDDTSVDAGADPQPSELLSALAKQGTHLVRGDQYATLERPYLLDRLRDCLGTARRWSTEPTSDDLQRIAKVGEVLVRAQRGVPFELSESSVHATFRTELEQHAAGHLAPLVRSIEVGWDAELLRTGVVLVDLPGVGVANDEFRRVTAQWIRKARGVVLVVDRAGMSEASADLLRSSGFLNSLLHQSGDPEDLNATLLVAVVKLDATADDARAKEKIITPGAVRPWAVHFQEACEKAIVMVREQLTIELEKVSENGGESTRDERAEVIQRVLEGMQVHPVVAPQYRMLLADDEDDRPRIKTAEESRIPKLSQALAGLVAERNERMDARIDFLTRNVSERVRGLLELTQAKAEQEGTKRHQQAEKVRRDAEAFADPLRREVINKQGEFREFLRSTVPMQIEARVDAAAEAARNDIAKHLKKYGGYHWGTLRAAVRRGGRYEGSRSVDFPADMALLFEEPVAIVWSKYILTELSARTAAMGREYVSVVGDLVDWGRRQGDDLDAKVLEAMHRELQAQMNGLGTLGREAIDELRNAVKRELYERVEAQIRQHCERFVKKGNDRGRGVKDRMLDLLSELADVVVDAARPVAREVLMRQYQPVQAEIRAAFDKYRNPVDAALVEIVGDTTIGERKKTAERQLKIAARAKELLTSLPGYAQSARSKAAE